MITTNQEKLEYSHMRWFYDKMNDVLEERFCLKYNGGMSIYKGETNYTMALHLNNVDNPLIIAGDFLTDDEFLNYIINEMVERKIFMASFDRINRVYD